MGQLGAQCAGTVARSRERRAPSCRARIRTRGAVAPRAQPPSGHRIGHRCDANSAFRRGGGAAQRYQPPAVHRAVSPGGGTGTENVPGVLRFQRALQSLREGEPLSLASLAAETGYSDQAHFNRDFLAFTGVTPMTYQKLSPREANHLPVDGRGDCHA
ncbi:MAG: helix-turn-helix domain-containing protein [Pseudomonadota bacterium]